MLKEKGIGQSLYKCTIPYVESDYVILGDADTYL